MDVRLSSTLISGFAEEMDVLFLDKDPHEVDDLRQVEEDKETTKSEEKGNRE